MSVIRGFLQIVIVVTGLTIGNARPESNYILDYNYYHSITKEIVYFAILPGNFGLEPVLILSFVYVLIFFPRDYFR